MTDVRAHRVRRSAGPPARGETPDSSSSTASAEPFSLGELHGEVVSRFKPADLAAEVRRLTDPAAAAETVHWGRNYLYLTHLDAPEGRIEVVVKQFRGRPAGASRLLARLRRRGSKAARSFRMARRFEAAGLPTPEAVMFGEPTRPDRPSYFVSRHLDGVIEARYLLRAAGRGEEQERFPDVDFDAFLTSLGRTLRRMHDLGYFHRDLSIGNVLVRQGEPGRGEELYLVDLNRARYRGRLSLSERTRDLCRLSLHRREHQRRFLEAYWSPQGASPSRVALYRLYHHGFHLKIATKKRLRELTRGIFGWLRPRRPYPHLPAAPDDASARDKIVWDRLSDQPHQHAGPLEKLSVRMADVGDHARQAAIFLGAAPRIWRRYRQLRRELYSREAPFTGAGICVRPYPRSPEKLLAALADLGSEHVLLRLHPWEEDHDDEEALARELCRCNYELTFALPQNRDLVRDPRRWRAKIEELAERFTPYGRHFQVGQAINRSKWGVWSPREYLELARSAAEILRRHPDVEILGPAVIDFEVHVTAAVLNEPRLGFRFDAAANLLYVDRRGAPENPQLGFDTAEKALLLRAISETARNSTARTWITEFNWPLWEGPHAPAGRAVAVDDETQADYLVRYLLLTLSTGAIERAFWWQLVARGYGLCDPGDGGTNLRRRPGFRAFAHLMRQLRDTRFVTRLPSPSGAHLHLFRHPRGHETVAGWSSRGRVQARLPRRAEAASGRDGDPLEASDAPEVELSNSVRYFRLRSV